MRIEPALSRIPVIMVSGYPEEQRFACDRAIADFFGKPASLEELRQAIDRHCGQPS